LRHGRENGAICGSAAPRSSEGAGGKRAKRVTVASKATRVWGGIAAATPL